MEFNAVDKETVMKVCDFYLNYKYISEDLRNTVKNIKSNVAENIYDDDCYQMLNHYGWEFCFENNKHFKNVLAVMKKIKK